MNVQLYCALYYNDPYKYNDPCQNNNPLALLKAKITPGVILQRLRYIRFYWTVILYTWQSDYPRYIFPVFLELPGSMGFLPCSMKEILYHVTHTLKYNKTLYEVVNARTFWSHGRVWQCYTHTYTHAHTHTHTHTYTQHTLHRYTTSTSTSTCTSTVYGNKQD